jgi:hypothetical protein
MGTVTISVFDLDVIQSVFYHLSTGASYQMQPEDAQRIAKRLHNARMMAIRDGRQSACSEQEPQKCGRHVRGNSK